RFAMLGASAALIGFMFSQTIKSIREYKKIAAERAGMLEQIDGKGANNNNIMNEISEENSMQSGKSDSFIDKGNGGNNKPLIEEKPNEVNDKPLISDDSSIDANHNPNPNPNPKSNPNPIENMKDNLTNTMTEEESFYSISPGDGTPEPNINPKDIQNIKIDVESGDKFGKYNGYKENNYNIENIDENGIMITKDGKLLRKIDYNNIKTDVYTADGKKIFDGMTIYDAEGAPLKFNEKTFSGVRNTLKEFAGSQYNPEYDYVDSGGTVWTSEYVENVNGVAYHKVYQINPNNMGEYRLYVKYDEKVNYYNLDGELIDHANIEVKNGLPYDKYGSRLYRQEDFSMVMKNKPTLYYHDSTKALYDEWGNPFFANINNVNVKYVAGNDYFTIDGKLVQPEDIVLKDINGELVLPENINGRDVFTYDRFGNKLYRVTIGVKSNSNLASGKSVLCNYKSKIPVKVYMDSNGYLHDMAGNLLFEVEVPRTNPTFKDIFTIWKLPDIFSNPDENYKGNYSGDLGLDIDLEDGAFAKYVSPNAEQEAIVYPIL
ncbi:hypothetical protein, partial [uncultured Methanobrevibacter sp.]|uniref:hypothetical protein n=1 Tax=uncultured Methanobrevibacter sp. TaxID=253161 RepID=UPI0025F1A70A